MTIAHLTNLRNRVLCACRAALWAILAWMMAAPLLACEPPAAGTTSWWPGDASPNDFTDGNHGLLQSGAGYQEALVGQGFLFDGYDDVMAISDAPNMQFGTDSFSFEAWVNASGFPYNYNTVAQKWYESDNYTGFCLIKNVTGKWRVEIGSGGTFINLYSVTPAQTGEFVHLAFTVDRAGRSVRLFVNGTMESAAVIPVGFGSVSSASALLIGRAWYNSNIGNYLPFQGRIDEPALYHRVLTACEIEAIYLAGAAGKCKGDRDLDGVPDARDNCPEAANPSQSDGDFDGAGDACDCAPADSGVLSVPSEIAGLRVTGGTSAQVAWCSAESSSGSALVYDVVRGVASQLPVGSGPSEVCIATGTSAWSLADSTVPDPGVCFWYIVRGRNTCGTGTYGMTSSGAERVTAGCP